MSNKDIWVYTGYTYESLTSGSAAVHTAEAKEMLSLIDILVDGPFIEDKKNIRLRFKGSENQRIIDVKKTISQGQIVLME